MLAIAQDRHQVLSAEAQFLLVAVPAQLDCGIQSLVRERHANAPAIGAVSPAILVDEIIKRERQERPHRMRKKAGPATIGGSRPICNFAPKAGLARGSELVVVSGARHLNARYRNFNDADRRGAR